MKETYFSVFSEPETLRKIASRLINDEYLNTTSGQRWDDGLNRDKTMIFVPSNSLQEAIAFSNSGGSLIWLGSSLRKKPDRLLRPALSIHGVNSVSLCRHVIFYALEFIIDCTNSHSSSLILLPNFIRSRSHAPAGNERLPSPLGL
jgi:hypothetical protein